MFSEQEHGNKAEQNHEQHDEIFGTTKRRKSFQVNIPPLDTNVVSSISKDGFLSF